jgi:polyisoprenyl-phosphate glycosyltransferase
METPLISVIVPVYNEEKVLPATCARLRTVLKALGAPYEVLFVDDGSRDRTLDLLRRVAAEDPSVRVLALSRNFGQQIAITAGLEHCSGRTALLIDGDLQDPPELIPDMLALWRQGWDVVYGKRTSRTGEKATKKTTSRIFYRLLRWVTDQDIPVDTGDFRLMDRKVVDALVSMKEQSKFYRGMVSWVGFRQTPLEFVREARAAGKTKFTWRRMVKLAVDGIVSFSIKPLRIATWLGTVVSVGSFAGLIWVLVRTLTGSETAPGWASLAVIDLFFSGVVLILIGVLGEYIGRIFEQSRARPLYFLQERIGFGPKSDRSGKSEEVVP